MNNKLRNRIAVSILVVSIFLLGRNIPLPYFGFDASNINPKLNLLTNVLGGTTSKTQIFMIGLGPYMSSMILWRLFTMIKWFRLDQLTMRGQQIGQGIVAVIIAIIQSYAIVIDLTIGENPLSIQQKLIISCVLIV